MSMTQTYQRHQIRSCEGFVSILKRLYTGQGGYGYQEKYTLQVHVERILGKNCIKTMIFGSDINVDDIISIIDHYYLHGKA